MINLIGHILQVYCSQVLSVRTKKPSLGFAETAEVAFQTGPPRYKPLASFARSVFIKILDIFFTKLYFRLDNKNNFSILESLFMHHCSQLIILETQFM